ncbi:MAG: hypothetical protein SWH54_16770 [Thermodesulfobacteriota bacterium]|nr:hypothetical protein [Thermodesulfobacteriota bacterium]
MKKFEHIIRIAQNTKAVSLPDGFTEKVMENLPPGPHTSGSKLREFLLLALQKLNLRSWIEVETVAECAVCFLMVGFFYVIMGIVMALGLKTMGGQSHVSGWIMIQPQIAFASAIVFIFLGILLFKKRMLAIKLAYGTAILYIGFSVFNSAGIQMATGNPLSAAGMLCLTSGAVLLGVFLTVIVHKYRGIMLMENF